MGSFSGLGIGLSLVFGCVLFGLVGELYYLLWWKRRISSREIEDHHNKYAKELFYHFCWKKPISVNNVNSQELTTTVTIPDGNGHEPDLELGSNKDLLHKGYGEESIEAEIMRLHNLCGPPRFLFTIKEETNEDLESDDVKSKGDRSRKGSRNKSLSDLFVAMDLTPLSSPTMKSHHHHNHPLDSYNHHGFNPLFESSTDAEVYKLRSSPPPKFKFLRDAEEKLVRRLIEEAAKKAEEKNGSTFTFVVGKKSTESIQSPHQHLALYHSTASQVLPLASSPSTTTTASPYCCSRSPS